jgi:hypothetical protein
MASRNAAQRPGGRTQAQSRPADSTDLADALGVLDARRRDMLIEAMAISARELLRASDLKVSLPKVAERIGIATGVDRSISF